MRKLILSICILFICSTAWCGAYEDFDADWSETDPNNHLSQTVKRSTFAGYVWEGEDADLTRDANVSMTGDFDIAYEIYIDSATDNGKTGTIFTFFNDNDDQLSNQYGDADGTNAFAEIWYYNVTGDDFDADDNDNTLLVDTLYYVRFQRDDDAGGSSAGQLTLDFYSTAPDREHESNVVLNITLDQIAQIDYTDTICPWSIDDGTPDQITGYLENLDLTYNPRDGIDISKEEAEQLYKDNYCKKNDSDCAWIGVTCCEDEEGCLIEGCQGLYNPEQVLIHYEPEWDLQSFLSFGFLKEVNST